MTREHKIHVVDQDASARNGLVRLLAKAGYEAVGHDSLEAFLASFEGELTGCVVMDATTIGPMNGLSLEALRGRCARAAVLVIAADDDPKSRKRAGEMKAEAFFRKPVDGVALLDAISWSLR
jgi:two-component system response regulator FixJ